MITLHQSAFDSVIKSQVAMGSSNYKFALSTLFPLIDRFEEQRKLQRPKFYERLQKDLRAGCIMPPITLAFVAPEFEVQPDMTALESWINEHISTGYILDGMQRLNTLFNASTKGDLNVESPIFLTIIVSKDHDNLLYRMITLNNGQKPMSVRHQVEMLTKTVLSSLVDSGRFANISILSEKATERESPKGSFKRSDIVTAYMAFLTKNVNNQSSKIIEGKLDEILVGRMMEHAVSSDDVSFKNILLEIDRLCEESRTKTWFQNENNMIGFAVGASKSHSDIQKCSSETFFPKLHAFEDAFALLESSKINVGKMRRDLAMRYFSKFAKLGELDTQELHSQFLEWLADD